MLDLSRTPGTLLEPVARVVETALARADGLAQNDIMIVGASCRDILHTALGHTFVTTATRDLDLALALSSWDAYTSLVAEFQPVGHTGIRFTIAGLPVDLVPFGAIENPQGVATLPSDKEPMSVWAFDEIFAASLPLVLTPTTTIRLPTVAGFAAAKLAAWLDRSAWSEAKDAADLALILHWYVESDDVHDRLYETPEGNEVFIAEGTDLPLAAARLLGIDITRTIGPQLLPELLERWPGDVDLLVRRLEFRGDQAWPRDVGRRRHLIEALSRGLRAEFQP